MTKRIKRVADGVIFTWTAVLAQKKGFVEFDDDKPKVGLTESKPPVPVTSNHQELISLEDMSRKQIGEYILETYGIQIPKMGRKTKLIKKDAYEVMEEFRAKALNEKEHAEAEERYDNFSGDSEGLSEDEI